MSKPKRLHKRLVRGGLTILVLTSLMCYYGIFCVSARGSSMFPVVFDGDYMLISEIATPKRFDVVVVDVVKEFLFCKRIIGLPGDSILLSDQIYVNGEVIREYYLSTLYEYTHKAILLGPNEYFVLGDNRTYSFDSRMFGPITREQIKGVFICRVWRSRFFRSVFQ